MVSRIKELSQKVIFWEILQGLGLTFKYMWTKPITMRYPEERWIPSERFRGQVALVRDPEKPEQDLCVGCCLCARVCPSNAISLVTSGGENNKKIINEYYVDVSRCIFCGMCVEICPVKALVSTDLYELATDDRSKLRRNKQTLLEQGHAWRKRRQEYQSRGCKPQTVIK